MLAAQCVAKNATDVRTCGLLQCFFFREHFMNSVINKNHYTELNWIKSSFFFLNIYCQFVLYLGSLIRFNKGLVSRHMSAH